MSRPKIICACGKAEHGKTTFTNLLIEEFKQLGISYFKLSYGDYVKFVATKYYDWDGAKDEKGRKLLQWLGTDYVKSKDKYFWVDTVIRLAEVLADDKQYVLIDDCRFPEELSRWTDNGYEVIDVKILRPNHISKLTEIQLSHPSETSLDHFDFSNTLVAKNIVELKEEVNAFLDKVVLNA